MFGQGKSYLSYVEPWRRMGVEKFDFEGVGMVADRGIAERGIDGGREREMKSCDSDGAVMACHWTRSGLHAQPMPSRLSRVI